MLQRVQLSMRRAPTLFGREPGERCDVRVCDKCFGDDSAPLFLHKRTHGGPQAKGVRTR